MCCTVPRLTWPCLVSAIVWAPNLVTINAVADPMQAIVRSRMMCRFLKKLLAWRLLTEHGFTEEA